ncbi:hypothetical protein PLESTF_001677300 [Pleodorina starrii]|nr:hypothetical protein PLESTF_001677300 [Pleodorina starrii]
MGDLPTHHATSRLPPGVSILQVSPQPSAELPFLLYLPDIDGAGVTSKRQWQAWTQRFDMRAVTLDANCTCSFAELAAHLRSALETELAGVSPYRPVYLLGEGFGAVLALQLAWDCRRLVNRLVLVNPATSYGESQLARITALLERIPPALLNVQLPAPPQLPIRLPLPLPPPPLPLPVALAPLLGTSPQTLLRQLVGSLSSQQPAEAVQALNRALAQVEQISSHLTPAAFLCRLKMLEEGIRMVGPRLPSIRQRTLVLAGGQDVVLGSDKEAQRLVEALQRAFKRVLPDSGHALLYEPGGELLPLLDQEGFYIRRRVFSSPVRPGVDVNAFGTAAPVEVPNEQEIGRYASSWTSRLRELNSPVFLSTLPDGSRVLGLEGLPHRKRHRQERAGQRHDQQQQQDRHGHHHQQQQQQEDHAEEDGSGLVATTNAHGESSHHHHQQQQHEDQEGAEAEVEYFGDGPLLFVGNHQLYAFDMSVMVEEVLKQRGILMRGLAHPGLFRQAGEDEEGEAGSGAGDAGARPAAAAPGEKSERGSNSGNSSNGNGSGSGSGEETLPPAFMGNMFQSFGAVRVTPTAMYRLLAAGEAVLLYPGGVREGFKRRNEKYELFWPSRSEFVRMAARFGATVIPVSAVGLEDSLQILMDSDDIRRSPLWGARAREQAASVPRARIGVAADDAPDETFIPPLIAPAVPSRFYFLFGRPVVTSPDMYRDRAACDEVYRQVRSDVESGISYLLRKREQDPYRDFLRRVVYEQNPPFGPRRVAPTFKL